MPKCYLRRYLNGRMAARGLASPMATRKDAAIGGQGPWLPIIDGALAGLLRDNLAGAADVGWKVLELREPITHRQHCSCIVDVHLRLEHQVWDGPAKTSTIFNGGWAVIDDRRTADRTGDG